ncbi:hypothetical protein [Acinetobacter phage AB1I1M-1]
MSWFSELLFGTNARDSAKEAKKIEESQHNPYLIEKFDYLFEEIDGNVIEYGDSITYISTIRYRSSGEPLSMGIEFANGNICTITKSKSSNSITISNSIDNQNYTLESVLVSLENKIKSGELKLFKSLRRCLLNLNFPKHLLCDNLKWDLDTNLYVHKNIALYLPHSSYKDCATVIRRVYNEDIKSYVLETYTASRIPESILETLEKELKTYPSFEKWESIESVESYWIDEVFATKALEQLSRDKEIRSHMDKVFKMHERYNSMAYTYESIPAAPIKCFASYETFINMVNISSNFKDYEIENYLRSINKFEKN